MISGDISDFQNKVKNQNIKLNEACLWNEVCLVLYQKRGLSVSLPIIQGKTLIYVFDGVLNFLAWQGWLDR